MYNCHQLMLKFHNDHVRLPRADQDSVAEHRNTNLDRLNRGLDKLSEEDGTTYAHPIDHCDQGSYAMRTMVQSPTDEFDLDEAIIFNNDDLPAAALTARKRVGAAFNCLGDIFSHAPEVRTNAVTIWYAEGSHVDFAIYRRYKDAMGRTITEHAGPDWAARDPREVTAWFQDAVDRCSPAAAYGATVPAEQLRRIVRLLKAFAKSRDNTAKAWSSPGGFITSALAVECYRANAYRDDLALYDTMVEIRRRIARSTEVPNPIDPTLSLTGKKKQQYQVRRFGIHLGQAIDDHLARPEAATEAGAKRAWHWVFQHDFWLPDVASASKSASDPLAALVLNPADLKIFARVADAQYGSSRRYQSGTLLPRKKWLLFSYATSIQQPYSTKWLVQNYGEEAEDADDATLRFDGSEQIQWESTRYKGSHFMICEVWKNGILAARAHFRVRIAGY